MVGKINLKKIEEPNDRPHLSRRRFIQGASAVLMNSAFAIAPVWAVGGMSEKVFEPRRLSLNPLRFNGERKDPATGLYHLGQGYRLYNPATMRFNSCDSLSPFGIGGVNAYSYCLGDPVNLTDPSGHAAVMTMIIGGAVGAVVGSLTAATGEGIRSAATSTPFDGKQVAIGAALGAISGVVGVATGGASRAAKAGLALADAITSAAIDYGVNVAAGDDNKQAAKQASIGAVIGLMTYGTGSFIEGLGLKPLRMVKDSAVADRTGAVNGSFAEFGPNRDIYRVSINNGLLYQNGTILDTGNKFMKFIHENNGSLFAVTMSGENERVKHSALLGNEWPISAGMLKVRHGTVEHISNISGHFRPTAEHLEVTIDYLKEHGVLCTAPCDPVSSGEYEFVGWSAPNVVGMFDFNIKPTRVKSNVTKYRRKYL